MDSENIINSPHNYPGAYGTFNNSEESDTIGVGVQTHRKPLETSKNNLIRSSKPEKQRPLSNYRNQNGMKVMVTKILTKDAFKANHRAQKNQI